MVNPPQDVPVALFLGGFDPSGGAGILRDAVVASSLGVHPMAISLAETIQNGFECLEISPPAASPMKRLHALRPHLNNKWGVKLSMFRDTSTLHDLLSIIHQSVPLVAIWDTIIAPTCGSILHNPIDIKKVFSMLSGDQWVISPNIPEARLIANMPVEPLEEVAKKLANMGVANVWLRGGHGTEKTIHDLWFDDDGPRWLTSFERLAGDARGTGCTVTSAWLAFRLSGMEPVNAAEAAVQYIRNAWSGRHTPGRFGRPTFPPCPKK